MGRPLLKTESKNCGFCGKPFSRKKYGENWEDGTRWKKRKFCSRSCSESKKEPTDRTTFHIRARKHKGKVCEDCGSTQNLDAHHKDTNIKNNSPENIKTLCHKCHASLHKRLRKLGTS